MFRSPGLASSRGITAGLRARLKSCCSIVSKSQPSDATMKTNQWYRVRPAYQGRVSRASAVEGDGFVVSKCMRVLRGSEDDGNGSAGPPRPVRLDERSR